MEALECIKTRRSVRKYSDQPVTRETLDKIFEAVTYAPSWKNTQSVRYTVVDDPALKAEIAEKAVLGFALNQKTISRCPVLLIQSTVNSISGHSPDGSVDTSKGDTWTMYDAGISAQTLCLAATDCGLGTVIMGVSTKCHGRADPSAREPDRHRHDRHRLPRRRQQNASPEARLRAGHLSVTEPFPAPTAERMT